MMYHRTCKLSTCDVGVLRGEYRSAAVGACSRVGREAAGLAGHAGRAVRAIRAAQAPGASAPAAPSL